MATRVLSTDQAKTSIQKIQAIINGGLSDEIKNLDNEGKTLSQPDVWDGPLAHRFRDEIWPQTKTALEKAMTELEDLRNQLDKISADIMRAGGG